MWEDKVVGQTSLDDLPNFHYFVPSSNAPSELSSFDKIAYMNTVFGKPKGDPDNVNWVALENQVKNILDEYNELLVAIGARNVKEVRDALCDIDVFSMGAHHLIGHNADHDLGLVYDSNMSKLIGNDEDKQLTQEKYDALGVEVYFKGEYQEMAVFSTKEQTDINGEVYRANKFLKGIRYFKPKW